MLFSSLTFIFAVPATGAAAVLLGQTLLRIFRKRDLPHRASLLFYGLWGWKLLPVLILVAGLKLPGLVLDRPERRRSEKTLAGLRHCRQPADTDRFQVHEFLIDISTRLRDFRSRLPISRSRSGSLSSTFQQIAYLVTVANNMERRKLLEYLLFVACSRTSPPADRGSAGIFSQRDQYRRLTTDRLRWASPCFRSAAQESHHRGELAPYANHVSSKRNKSGAVGHLDACWARGLYFLHSNSTSRVTRRWRWCWAMLLGLRLPLNSIPRCGRRAPSNSGSDGT